MKWYVDALIRDAGLFPIHLDAEQRASYRTLIMDRLSGQIRYHGPRHAENSYIASSLKRVSTFIFFIAVISCALALATTLSWKFNSCEWFTTAKPVVDQIISSAVLFTIWGAALAAFAYQAEFSKLAQTSSIIVQQLIRLRSEVDGTSNSGEHLRQAATETAEVFMQEHEDWYLFYSLRELEKPN